MIVRPVFAGGKSSTAGRAMPTAAIAQSRHAAAQRRNRALQGGIHWPMMGLVRAVALENDGPARRLMIFLLNSAVLADQKWPHQAAENVQPRSGRKREECNVS